MRRSNAAEKLDVTGPCPKILCVPKRCNKVFVERINPYKIQHLGEDKLKNERNTGKRPSIDTGRWEAKTFKRDWNDKGAGFSGRLVEKGKSTTKTTAVEETIEKFGKSHDVDTYTARFDFGRDTFRY